MGGWYDKEGNSVNYGQEGVYTRYSNILKDFESFKEKTNGVIYQHKKVNLQSWFREDEYNFIKEHSALGAFDYTKVEEEKSKPIYIFTYWDKEYTFKELKKKGVWVEVPIHFNTLLDLLPYLPYIVTSGGGNHVVISDKSEVDESRDNFICNNATDSVMFDSYKKELADLYKEVCKEYFLKDIDKRTKIVPITDIFRDECKEGDTSRGYILQIQDDEIDYMHDIEFVWKDGNKHSHWTSPKYIDEHNIAIDEKDVEYFLKDDIKDNNVSIKYVQKLKN